MPEFDDSIFCCFLFITPVISIDLVAMSLSTTRYFDLEKSLIF